MARSETIRRGFAVFLAWWLCALALAAPVAHAAPPSDARPAELVVIPRAVASASDVAYGLMQRHPEVSPLAVGLSGRALLLRVPAGREAALRDRLAADPAVAAVARNYAVHADTAPLVPNDPSYPDQWGLAAVRAPEAWGAGHRATGVTVATIDTGADYEHPDLAGVLLPGCNFVLSPSTCSPTAAADDNGHGTHVAGTIAALTDNGAGVAGLAWGAKVLPLKALDSSGNGSWFSIVDAIEYATDQPGVRVINLSLGSDPNFPPDAGDQNLLRTAVDGARAKGIVVVAAAGNGGANLDATPVYPAVVPGVIAVTAVDQTGAKPSWANYGQAVALAAPGVNILSTTCTYDFAAHACVHGYGNKSGTSMATPHVAALAALLIAQQPSRTPDAVAALLAGSAVDLGAPGRDSTFGWGRIDAAGALAGNQLALSVVGPGTVQSTPAGTAVPPGGQVTLHATPDAGAALIGWTVDGADRGWPPSLSLTLDTNHTVVATFAPCPAFADLTPDATASAPVCPLAARGIVRGYPDGRFGPADRVLRAQVAALLVRAMGWSGESSPPPFTDQGSVDDELWRSVGTLADHGVVGGYGDGTYRPTGDLLHVQAISVISRAMVARGYWTVATTDDPTLYPNIPLASGHRLDLVTFVRNAGAVPDRPAASDWVDWDGPASRGWFARVLWQALDATFGVSAAP